MKILELLIIFSDSLKVSLVYSFSKYKKVLKILKIFLKNAPILQVSVTFAFISYVSVVLIFF
jgi:hypothetical protein